MRFFKKYIFPALYGLLVYFTVRLLHDTDVGLKFWKRPMLTNAIEMGVAILAGYFAIAMLTRLLRYFDTRWTFHFDYRTVTRELIILVFANLIVVNILFVPVTLLTDDGLS